MYLVWIHFSRRDIMMQSNNIWLHLYAIIWWIVFFSRRYLRETLKMANGEDLNRLTSCSLVLLGHIFYSLRNGRESMNMVTPAMQLASKIPDINVQLWATALLKGLIFLIYQFSINLYVNQIYMECSMITYANRNLFRCTITSLNNF